MFSRVLGKRDEYRRKDWHEGLSIDEMSDVFFEQALGEVPVDGDVGLPLQLLFASSVPTVTQEFLDTCKAIYSELLQTPVTTTLNNFPLLFGCMVRQILVGVSDECRAALGDVVRDKKVFSMNRNALAWELGVTRMTISLMIRQMSELPAMRRLVES